MKDDGSGRKIAVHAIIGGIKSQITGAGFFSNNMIPEELICSK